MNPFALEVHWHILRRFIASAAMMIQCEDEATVVILWDRAPDELRAFAENAWITPRVLVDKGIDRSDSKRLGPAEDGLEYRLHIGVGGQYKQVSHPRTLDAKTVARSGTPSSPRRIGLSPPCSTTISLSRFENSSRESTPDC